MRRMIELLLLQPTQVAHRPTLLARINAAKFEHEGGDLSPENPECLDSSSPGANKITHSFTTLVGHPHRCELAGSQ
jgi:hypothetical protein